LKPEDRNDMNTLRLARPDRDDMTVVERASHSIDNGDYTPLTKIEMLELAVDLDNLEEALRFAPDGDKEREMLQRWVDRLCQ